MAKYYLLAGDTSQISIFFPYMRIKVFIILFLLCLWNREHPDNFQNNSVSSPFN